MKNWKLIPLLVFLPISVFAQEKFKGVEFPYAWQKPGQSFFMLKNSVFTSDNRLNYEAYYLEDERIFRFVMISEIKNKKKTTVLQWIDDDVRARMFRLVKKRKLFFFVSKKWVEEAWLPSNDYQRLFKLISSDLAEEELLKEQEF